MTGVTSDTGPFIAVPIWLLERLEGKSGSTDLRVYCALATWADYDTGECWPSHRTIAEKAGVGASTVRSSLRRLRTMHAVDWMQTVTDQGDPGSNRYTVYRQTPATQRADPSPTQPTEGSITQRTTNENHVEREPTERENTAMPFESWYEQFPKHTGKHDASKLWAKMKSCDKLAALHALADWQYYADTHPEGNTYIPNAGRWLRQRMWEDDPPQVTQPDTAHTRSMQVLQRAATQPADIFAIGGTE